MNEATKFINLNSSPLLRGDASFSFIFLKDDLNKKLQYVKIDNKIFENNLVLIESHLPQILSEVIVSSIKRGEHSLSALIEVLATQNPEEFPSLKSLEFYRYKIKEFLKHLAFGLSPNKVYYGEPNVYEHYPVLKTKNGILYYGENTNLFLDTLLNNSIFTISSSGEFEKMDRKYIKMSFEISLLNRKIPKQKTGL